MSDKNFTRKEKSAYYSQCMQMYKNLYDLTKEQIKERGYASHRNLIRKICSTKNIVNAIRSISKNTGVVPQVWMEQLSKMLKTITISRWLRKSKENF